MKIRRDFNWIAGDEVGEVVMGCIARDLEYAVVTMCIGGGQALGGAVAPLGGLTMTLTLGYKASAEQFDPRELVENAVVAEGHGMESVWASDHFQPWRHTGRHAPSSLSWMAAVGERTSSVRIGTSVMTPTSRYNPAVLAQAFASLGMLYPGRIIGGFGTGEALNEIATGSGVPASRTGPRQGAVREAAAGVGAVDARTGDR
jgi:hypothetical protein